MYKEINLFLDALTKYLRRLKALKKQNNSAQVRVLYNNFNQIFEIVQLKISQFLSSHSLNFLLHEIFISELLEVLV